MFKIESYITPLLMGYLDKYVKLRPDDFQLSLWGGDAVLYNLDLRLDVIEKAMQLPIVFQSGHIHELRLHVPWTKLGSEPVIVTINTIECILKLRDTAYSDSGSQAGSVRKSASAQRQRVRRQDLEDLPPGYLQSLMNKIINNVSIIVNNLIVKFVEEDIVLSLNMKSAECYSVDKDWNRAFVELSPPDFVLRRAINFFDLTVCLDKRDASGRIENYQEPLVYRCSLSGRMYTKYDSIHAKYPAETKLQFYCERLDLSLTDTQLPMFIRIIELCLALYYGTLELKSRADMKDNEPDSQVIPAEPLVVSVGEPPPEEEDEKGWAAWAWSYVPQLLVEDDTEEGGAVGQGQRRRPPASFFSLGMYAYKMTLTFKLNERVREKLHYGPRKVSFEPFLYLEAAGIAVDVLMQGLLYFDAQCGITSLHVYSQGGCICGADGEEDTRNNLLLSGGDTLPNKTTTNYMCQSLFDPQSSENLGIPSERVLDWEQHKQVYTEQYGMQKFGVFWMDYLYVLTQTEDRQTHSSHSSVSSLDTGAVFLHENSLSRFVIGQCHLNVASTTIHRLQKLVNCAYQYEYEPYARKEVERVDENRPHPTVEQIKSLEEFIPTRTYHVTLLQPIVSVLSAEHEHCDVAKKTYKTRGKGHKDRSGHSPMLYPLFGIQLSSQRFDLQVTSPMYPRKLVQLVSTIAGPSGQLLHPCHSHTQLKLFGFHIGLTRVDAAGVRSPLQTLVPPTSGAMYTSRLMLPMYWKNSYLPKVERMYELPQVCLSITKAGLLVVMEIVSSWKQQTPKTAEILANSLMDDVFPSDDTEAAAVTLPVLELTMTGFEMKSCRNDIVLAYAGTVSSIQTAVHSSDAGKFCATPILYGSTSTDMLHTPDWLAPDSSPLLKDNNDCFTFTCQVPQKLDHVEAPAVILINTEGIACCLDPVLLDWLDYTPTQKVVLSKEKKIELDMELALAASPLQANISQISQPSSGSTRRHTESLTYTRSPTEPASTIPAQNPPTGDTPAPAGPKGWGEKIADVFPLVRLIQVQVEVKKICLFLPQSHVPTTDTSLSIPQNLQRLAKSQSVPDMIVVCLPHVTVQSAGLKPVSCLQEIPITSMDGSLVGDKIPWNVSMHDFSVYTIHGSTNSGVGPRFLPLVKPATVTSTVGLSYKYSPLTSDNISALGLCLHTDMHAVTISSSHDQIKLAMDISSECLKLIGRSSGLIVDLVKPLESQDRKMSSTNLKPTPAPSLLRKPAASNTSLTDGDAMFTETSDITSLDTTPSRELEILEDSVAGVKLSLWLQWTLPRCEMRLYSNGVDDVKISLALEDIAASVDVQDVYAKVKMNIGSVNVNHFVRTRDTTAWENGPYDGILMSCHGNLSHDTNILTTKLWSSDQQRSAPPSASRFSSNQQREKTHGFINLTFTRALCKNVKKRFQKMNLEIPSMPEMGNDNSLGQFYFHKYVSEICVNLNPFDVVFCASTVHKLIESMTTFEAQKPASHRTRKASSVAKEDKWILPLLTSSNLPLIYADFSCFRLFIPGDVSGKPAPKFSIDRLVTTEHNDTCVVQVQSCSIAPQADNPLPRYPVDPALYQRATQLGVTTQPGAALLDRQFQLDLHGFSVATGCWSGFVEKGRSSQKSAGKPGTQIPAYEWNTLQSFERHVDEEIKLYPLVAPCDLKLVAAPAIVNVGPAFGSSQLEHTLVCGYALEFNVISDLDLYTSTNQIHLLEKIATQTISNLSAVSAEEVPPDDIVSVHGMDSGIGSDISGMPTDRSKHRSRTQPVITDPTRELNGVNVMTPFDVLLTAGRISFTVYTHDVADTEIKLPTEKHSRGKTKPKVTKHDLEWQVDPHNRSADSDEYVLSSPMESHDLKFMNIRNEFAYDSGMNVIPAASTIIEPFMYFYISQPHMLVSCHRKSQKFEMSCYDILIKGPSGCPTVQASEHRLLPECSDFCVYWLETRAGQPHPNTGIPPCLYTLGATDFLREPACVSLRVERPVQLTVNFAKLKQVQTFLDRLSPTSTVETTRCDKNRKHTAERHSQTPALLSKVKHVEFVTDEVVVVMETRPCDQSPAVTASISSLRMETELEQNDKGAVDTITASTYARDIYVKTSYNDSTLPLIGPCSMKFDGSYSNCYLDNKHILSQSIVTMATGLVLINVGQEHVLCLSMIAEHVGDLLKELSPVKRDCSTPTPSPQGVPTAGRESRDPYIVHTSMDDLRSGGFQYILDTDTSGMLPSVGEIIFCDRDKDGNSTMAWSYSMPRVISHIRCTPVPFAVTTEGTRVVCSLQFWEHVTEQFIDYVDLELHEEAPSDAQLPDVRMSRGHDLAVACTWRIVILQAHTPPADGGLVLLPTSLAAAMKVDSCFIPSLVPAIQLGCTMESLELHLSNHLQCMDTDVPAKLKPFYMNSCFPASQEFSVLTMDNILVAGSHLTGQHAKTQIQFSTHVSLDVVEYKALTMQRVTGPALLTGTASWQQATKPPMIDVDLSCEQVTVRVGRSVVHTVTTSLQAWHHRLSGLPGDGGAVFSHYVICNDTQQAIRLGQVGTDENLVLQPREMLQYSWRSHRGTQQIHACLDGRSWKWCNPFDINTPRVVEKTVTTSEQQYTFIIDIRRLSNVQNQVIFTGQLHVYNRLSQPVEVKVITMEMGEEHGRAIVGPGRCIPSYVVGGQDVAYIKFRPRGSSGAWSKEVHVSGDKMQDSRLIKFTLGDKTTFHAWCMIFNQDLKTAQQIFVVLCPLYIVRSHLPRPMHMNIDTSKLNIRRQMETAGRGSQLQLVCAGGDIHHAVTFQFTANSGQSSTAVTLSTGLIEQLQRAPYRSRDVRALLDDEGGDMGLEWPYFLGPDGSSHADGPREPGTSRTLPTTNAVDQPTIDLNVTLSECWPGCGTVIVDVTPWCLLNNQCGLDLLIMGTEDKTYEVPKAQTISPPKLEGSFHVGAGTDDGTVCMSAAIPISDEEVAAQRYRRDLGTTLYLDSYVYMAIFAQQGSEKQIYFLTVTSSMKHQMRIITIRERFMFTNFTGYQLALAPVTVPLWSDKVDTPTEAKVILNVHQKEQELSELTPLSFHPLLHSDSELAVEQEIDATTEFLHYLSISGTATDTSSQLTGNSSDGSAHVTSNASDWSYPVRLSANENGCRMTVSVLLSKGCDKRCTPLCITGQVKNGISHFVIRDDTAPACLLLNHCSFPVLFGATSMNLSLKGPTTQEEPERVNILPTVPPGGQVYYTPPFLNATFPAALDSRSVRSLQISALEDGATDIRSSPIHWSHPVDIQVATDTFVAIPTIADVRVHVTHVAMVTNITIEPISKAEVSAKEIRSRLKGKERTIIIESREVETSVADMKTELKEANEKKKDSDKACEVNPQLEQRYQYSCGLYLEELSLIITDELSSPDHHGELLRLTARDLLLAYYPASALTDPVSCRRGCMVASVGHAQLDNQIYSQGRFDFPVVIVRQDFNTPPSTSAFDYSEMNLLEKHAVLKSSSLFHVQIVMGTTSDRHVFIQSVEVSSRPLSCYIDDTFVFRVIKEIEGFIPTPLSCSKSFPVSIHHLPESVKSTSKILSAPIRIGHLSIQQLSLLLSVHASLKLFIACDHTPLTFGKFDKTNVCTSSRELTRDIVMHYASAALFRAGAVVGSLEILGSPTGLVRSIGTGVADFFRMPYRGLTRGPGAFVVGISHGTSSMVKNITQGMLTSITNFASSLSRNMDRLSLDAAHQDRQAEGRRHRPHGLSDGLKQGLTGLGLGVLGAIAGIADQPLQNIVAQQADSERASSKRSTASSLVTGVGKGLLGAVTKPIGGAAEFVSQTGQGILHGTGLSNFPTVHAVELITPSCDMACGQVKYAMKLLQHLPSSEILYCTEAGFVDLTDTLTPVTLILTPEVLFIMNQEEDAQQQAFSLLELECGVKLGSTSMLTLIWRDSFSYHDEEPGPTSEERVAAFIDGTVNFGLSRQGQITPPRAVSNSEVKQSATAPLSPIQELPYVTMAAANLPEPEVRSLPGSPCLEGPLGSLAAGGQVSVSGSGSSSPVNVRPQLLPQYDFHMAPPRLAAFLAVVNITKQKIHGTGFGV